MSASGTLIALDLLAGFIEATAKINVILQKAASEGRNVSQDELNILKSESDKLEEEIANL